MIYIYPIDNFFEDGFFSNRGKNCTDCATESLFTRKKEYTERLFTRSSTETTWSLFS